MTAWTSIHGVMEPCPWRDDDVPWRHGTPSMAPWNEGNAAVLPLHGRIDRKQCRSDRCPWRRRPTAKPQCSASTTASTESEAMLPWHDVIARPQRANTLLSSRHRTRATRQCSPLMPASAGSNAAVLHHHDVIEARQCVRGSAHPITTQSASNNVSPSNACGVRWRRITTSPTNPQVQPPLSNTRQKSARSRFAQSLTHFSITSPNRRPKG